MNRLILLILSVALAGSAGPAHAGPAWNNRVWDVSSGMLGDRVFGVKQSSDGFLWVAVSDGVMRFDGLEFRAISVGEAFRSGAKIYAIFIDSLDRLWIAHDNGEILCVERGHVVIKIPPPSNVIRPRCPTIVEERAGVVMFCFPAGDFFRVCDGKVEPVKLDGLAESENRQVVKDGLGQVWLANGTNGFGVIKDGRFLLKGTLSVNNIAGARSGGVWIRSGSDIWNHDVSGALGKICSLPIQPDKVSNNAFHEDSRGGVWIGSDDSGLFHLAGNSFSKIPFSHKRITCIDEDKAGNIWVGSVDSLNQLNPAVVRFIPSGNANINQNAYTICEDTSNVLWAVWNTGNISKSKSRDPLESESLKSWSVLDSKAVPLAECAVADPSGGVWCGTYSSGVFFMQNGIVVTNLTTQNGLSAGNVSVLHMTGDGELWIGSKSFNSWQPFLQSLRAGTLRTYHLPADSLMVTAITSDSSSNCWISTYGGYLFRVDSRGILINETTSLGAGWFKIKSLCLTPDGSLWIGFSGQGLGRLKNGRFRRYMTDQGLHENSITRILFDGSERLWFAGNRGVFSILIADFDDVDAGRSLLVQSVAYGKNEGLPNTKATEFYWPGAIRDSSGRLLFTMKGGLALINPVETVSTQPPPQVIIDRVKLDGRTIAGYGAGGIFHDPAQSKPVELRQSGKVRLQIPPGSSHLEIAFTALSSKLPESTVFRCRLNGLNDEWRDIGPQRTVSYYDMPPGDYHFQVIARNSDGVWNDTGASLALTIEPYWWETALFRVGGPLAVFGVLLAGVILFLRHRQRLQLERLEILRATENERARIAADLHDEMGSGLTEIGMTGDLVLGSGNLDEQPRQYVGEIVDKARSLTESLDEIVWAANPKHDSVASLVGYFVYYIQHILEKASIRVRLDIPDNLPKAVINPNVRHHLFLAFREAVTNVVKHAGAAEVRLSVAVEDGMLNITIHDDGRGIGQRPDGAQGDGLSNMRHRLEQIGGKCSVSGEPGQGTTVKFEVELTGSFYHDSVAG